VVAGIDGESDLALLVIKAVKTSPVKWAKAETVLGATVLTVTPVGEVACLGSLSHGPLGMKEVFKRGVPDWFRPQMIRLGAVPTRRLTGFSRVIQHDSPLYPEQCGGPLFNLNGEAVGVNIARFGRVESFAIPADIAQTVIAKMKRATQE
jgi:S1-C subfamily serine protease